MEQKTLRKEKISARNNISPMENACFSASIIDKIIVSEVYAKAKTIMLYRSVKGEVDLRPLEEKITMDKKRAVFPLCISKQEMIALLPEDDAAWQKGFYGIEEPIRDQSKEVDPKEIDLVICPCTAFDEKGSRMGMGAGFYDRYLPKCKNAVFMAVAFEVQKVKEIKREPWDIPMDLIVTEGCIYDLRNRECNESMPDFV